MIFHEKLSFLMTITNTSNKELADAINVDPSLISLFRNGHRDASKNSNHIAAISAFLANRCTGYQQRIQLSEKLDHKYLPLRNGNEQLKKVLSEWLTDTQGYVDQLTASVENYLPEVHEQDEPEKNLPEQTNDSLVFYDNEGKRAAFKNLIRILQSLKKPDTVYLTNDENFDWFLEDESFSEWAKKQMLLLVQKGFTIQHIAPPSSSPDRAFYSLVNWIPLYMTGQVKAYYYPRLRDNIHRRTIIAVQNAVAFISSSIGDQNSGRLVYLTQNSRAVNSAIAEFKDFQSVCKPMLSSHILCEQNQSLFICASQFESDKGNRIQQSKTLSLVTSPQEIVKAVTDSSAESTELTKRIFVAQDMFRQGLINYETVDIIRLSSVQEIKDGKVPIAASYLFGKEKFYSIKTYIQHLKSILGYLDKYQNYCAVIATNEATGSALFVKDNRQVILARHSSPFTLFEISQPYVADAYREYLMRSVSTQFDLEKQRKNSIEMINKKLIELKNE